MSKVITPSILNLETHPWKYLLLVLDKPDIRLNGLTLRVCFKHLLKDYLNEKFGYVRFLKIPDSKYLKFACYLDGLITTNTNYNLATLDILVGEEEERYFPECYREELQKGLNKQKFGNKYIDTMLRTLR